MYKASQNRNSSSYLVAFISMLRAPIRLYGKSFLLWFIWLLLGSVFYAVANKNGAVMGFYMAINVGYSMGWGYPIEISDANMIFSIFYLLIGAFAVTFSLTHFAQYSIASAKEWHETILAADMNDSSKSGFERFKSWMKHNYEYLLPTFFFLLWVIILATYTCNKIGWSWIQGVYCAVSSFSTGGLWPIPNNSSSDLFLMVACFSATGGPLMALALAQLAHFFVNFGDPDAVKAAISAPITPKELEMLAKISLDGHAVTVDKAQYIILCAVRIGILSPTTLEIMKNNFDHLDSNQSGLIKFDEFITLQSSKTIGRTTDDINGPIKQVSSRLFDEVTNVLEVYKRSSDDLN